MRPINYEYLLKKYDENLSFFEAYFEGNEFISIDKKFPIFIIGLPRTGSTLLNQIMASTFNVGYISNLIAKFYCDPVMGILLQKTLESKKTFDFSQAGKNVATTNSIYDVNEFGYFWRRHLHINSIIDMLLYYKSFDEKREKELANNIQRIGNAFELNSIMKANFALYTNTNAIEKLKPIWILIERNVDDIIESLINVRKKKFGNLNHIWGMVAPDKYYSVNEFDYLSKGGKRSVDIQVEKLLEFYKNEIENKDKYKNVLKIGYSDLCKFPNTVLNSINDYIFDKKGVILKTKKFETNLNFKTYK